MITNKYVLYNKTAKSVQFEKLINEKIKTVEKFISVVYAQRFILNRLYYSRFDIIFNDHCVYCIYYTFGHDEINVLTG